MIRPKLDSLGQEMEEWKRDRDPEDGRDDDERLLHDEDPLNDANDDHENEKDENGVGRRGIRSTVWTLLAVVSTVNARRVLREGFPYPLYFILITQLCAYIAVAVTVLLIRLKNFRSSRRKEEVERYTFSEYIIMGLRILVSSFIAGFAMLCGAEAVLHYENLPVLAMLPILTYVSDSVVFRIAYLIRLLPRGQKQGVFGFYRVIVPLVCVAVAVNDDYRLNLRALIVALLASCFYSLSKVTSVIGPKIESKGVKTWETPLQVYLLSGILPLIMAGIASSRNENVIRAAYLAGSWKFGYQLLIFGPPILLQILFNSSLNTAYPFISTEHVGGALEEPTTEAHDAVASTLQSGFWILIIGNWIGEETTFISWTQVIALTTTYILCVGPKQIAYYTPRLFNTISSFICRRPLPTHTEPWQFLIILLSTVSMFAFLITTNTIFFIDTLAYKHSLSAWVSAPTLFLDAAYRPPTLRSFDIVIAHSHGESIQSITDLIATFPHINSMSTLAPRVTVYSKDPDFQMNNDTVAAIKGEFAGDLSIQSLRNVGGPTASFLHHILYSWAFLPVQTAFLVTHPSTISNLQLIINRMNDYFVPPDFPLPDALPKTGFLNLGEQETCHCKDCKDSMGWEDSFHQVPTMFAAARPGTTGCGEVLLTYGNNFLASAARLRGIKRDVWQLLYDALMNEDLGNAWAHNSHKMPKALPGELGDAPAGKTGIFSAPWKGPSQAQGVSRFSPGQIYGRPDTPESPWLGYTVERLWGILLQCSKGEMVWGCSGLENGFRPGGTKEDCGCIE